MSMKQIDKTEPETKYVTNLYGTKVEYCEGCCFEHKEALNHCLYCPKQGYKNSIKK